MTNKVNIQRAAAQRVPHEPLDSELASPEDRSFQHRMKGKHENGVFSREQGQMPTCQQSDFNN